MATANRERRADAPVIVEPDRERRADAPAVVEPDRDHARRLRPLIIERPDLQTLAQRYGYLSFTFAAWFLWLYLVVPMLSLLAWAAGLGIIYQAMIQNLATADLIDMLKVYGMGIGLFLAIYLVWAITSLVRWRNVERRQPAVPVDDASLARSHQLEESQLQAMRRAQRHVLSVQMLEQMFPPQPTADSSDPTREKMGS
jgi:biofilm PGA synthesis protein PgaD